MQNFRTKYVRVGDISSKNHDHCQLISDALILIWNQNILKINLQE